MTAQRRTAGTSPHTSSPRDGTARRHWLWQRATAVALVPLSLWFVISVLSLGALDVVHVRAWLSDPFSGSAFVLTMIILVYHSVLGLEVVIDDYIHTPCRHTWVTMGVRAVAALTLLSTVASCLTLMIG
jgi:succinate dehydrogenase / fumarate reductase membrane anchor subunit